MVDYGSIGEKQVVARPQDLAEVIRITNNMTSSDYNGIPSNKVSFMKDIFIPIYNSKTEPDSKGDKEEKIIAVTSKELCDYYKKVKNRGITTDNLKKQFLNELLANDIIGEIKSEIDGRQNIYCPLVGVEAEEQEEWKEENCKQQKQKITKLSNEELFDNLVVNGNCSASASNIQDDTASEHDLYWSDGLWGCKRCNLRSHKFGMQNTACKGNKRAK
jgi:hypothetical protein